MGALDDLMKAGPPPDAPSSDDGSGALSAAADDLIAAIGAKDSQGVQDALRSAFMALESEPHEEAGEAGP